MSTLQFLGQAACVLLGAAVLTYCALAFLVIAGGALYQLGAFLFLRGK